MPDYGHDLRLGTFITASRAPAPPNRSHSVGVSRRRTALVWGRGGGRQLTGQAIAAAAAAAGERHEHQRHHRDGDGADGPGTRGATGGHDAAVLAHPGAGVRPPDRSQRRPRR
jgi:hypothetical protein